MENFNNLQFNIFNFSKISGRHHVIELMTFKALNDLKLISII